MTITRDRCLKYRGYTAILNPDPSNLLPDTRWRSKYFIYRPKQLRPFAEANRLIEVKSLINEDINDN